MTFDVTAPDGQKFRIEGDYTPNESELNDIYSALEKGSSTPVKPLSGPTLMGSQPTASHPADLFSTSIPERPYTGFETPEPYQATRDVAKQRAQKIVTAATKPLVPIPSAVKKDTDNPYVATGKDVYNLLKSIPEFAESPAGVATAAASTVAAVPTAMAFSAGFLANLGKQVKSSYQNWDKMDLQGKTEAVRDMYESGLFAALPALGAKGGESTPKIVKEATDAGAPATAQVLAQTLKDTPDKLPEKITAAAIKTQEGVKTGANHPEILKSLGREVPPSDQRNTPEFGFQTDRQPFISREDAGNISTASGQNLKEFEPNEPAHSDEIAAPESDKPISETKQPVEPLNKGGSEKDLPADLQAKSKANNSREAFEALAKKTGVPLPKKTITLYRATHPTLKFNDIFHADKLKEFETPEKAGEFWTDDPKYADYFKESYGKGATIQTMEIPADEASKFKVRENEYKIPAKSFEPQKFRIGNNPQTVSLVERLPQSAVEKANNEQPVKVKNDKTGEVTTVMESDLTPVKKGEAKAPKTSVEDKLKGLGYNATEIAAMTKSGQKALADRGEPKIVGMGAAIPEEFENKPTTPTAIKNATVDQERSKRGLPPAMEPAKRAFGTVWDETMAKYDKDPAGAYKQEEDLVKELSEKPRAVTDSEDAILLHRQIELQNEYGKTTRDLAQAVDDAKEFPNRMEDAEELKIKAARISDQLLELYNVNKRVGTETGRGLAVRRMMAYEDYSLAAMETRLRAEQGGKELSEGQKTEVSKISKELQTNKKAIDDYQKKVESDSTSPQLKSLKTRYANRIEELMARIEAGDYAPKTKKPLQLDAEAIKLKAAYERSKLQFDKLAMKERLKNRTILQKTQDTFVKWRRAFLLSSPVTLAKLTSAAIERTAITPAEEAIGGFFSNLPIISQIADKAPREGGFNVRAEAKAITEGFTKGMADSYKTLTTGSSDIDSLYGKRNVMPHELIDFIGSVHGALKAPVKRAEFARSFQKRVEFAIRNGQDPSEPMLQTKIAVEAYKDAQRSIFMQDNRVTAAWNAAIAILKSPDKATGKTPLGRRTLASAAQVVLPIVKVPTNIVAETMQYAVGSVTGITRLASAFSKGVENLKPEEADLIMRNLKKGSLGAALLVLGYLNPESIGGYYQANDKKRVGHPKWGSIKVYGVNVPTYLIHNPLLETLQIGATIRHVADSRLRVKDQEKQGVAQGAIAAALGMSEEVPFVNEPLEFARMFDPYERDQFADQFARDMIVPLGASWVAQHFDKDDKGNYIVRKTGNLEDTLKSAIPGLRQTLPIDYKKTKLANQP